MKVAIKSTTLRVTLIVIIQYRLVEDSETLSRKDFLLKAKQVS